MIFSEMEILPLLYLIFRLCPIFIVFFFLMQSIISWNMQGLVLLLGLLITFFLLYLLGGVIKLSGVINTMDSTDEKINPRCVLINVGLNGHYLTVFPVSITIYSFTFAYLIGSLIYSDGEFTNEKTKKAILPNYIFMMIFFSLLIILELIWIFINNCFENAKNGIGLSIATILLCFCFGLSWAIVIDKTGMKELKVISAKNDNAVCTRPTKSYFRCKVIT
jgi:hypothetical protein